MSSGMPPADAQPPAGIFGDAPFAQEVPLAQTSDPTVLEVQRLLNLLGFGPVKETGSLDDATKEALRQFQAAENTKRGVSATVTGEPDTATVRALQVAASRAAQRNGNGSSTARPMWHWALLIGGGLAAALVLYAVVSGQGLSGLLDGGTKGRERKAREKCPPCPSLNAFERGAPVTSLERPATVSPQELPA